MTTDRLIPGNAYLWLDPDGQPRQVLYQHALLSTQGTLEYRFRVRIPETKGYAVSLTADQVLHNISCYHNHAH